MARLDPHEGFEILKSRVTGAIESNFPREGSAHTLELEGVQIKDDLDMNDIAAQKKAKLSGTTFGIPVKATMVLKDKGTGKVIEKKTLKVATLPKYTRRHSFIVKGSEYQVDNQWRLKPGIYTRVAQNGELQSRFNFQGKQALDMTFDPKTKVFRMKHGGSKPPLYPILKAVGIDDDTMQAAWGKDILNANKITAKGKALNVDKLAINFAKRLDPRAEVKSFSDASDVINAYMGGAELREDVTKLTLGKAFKKITPDVLTRSSKRLLGVARGEQKPDVRDALMFKDLLSIEDFIAERMGEGTKTIQRRIGNNLDRKDTIREIVGPDVFDRPIREFFSKSSLANTPQQVNPLEMLSGQQRTTITGEGGVKDAHKIMEEAKLVDPSHFGILDPLHTPESTKTGVSLHLCTSAVKRGKTVALPLVNVKTGKTELLDPKEINEQIIAMPDEGRWKDGKWKLKGAIVKASVLGNEIREVKSKDVKYVVKNTGQMFSLATNMVPFLSSDSPNRSTMAGRHMEQAIPLKNPEAPLVQSDRGDGRTYDEFVGRYASHEAPVAGKVTKIEPGAIHIKGADGKSQQIQIYDNYPLNDKKGVFHSTPVVKVGQQVKKGDLISDSNFTKNGVYAPGTNLKVGYSPWKGLNFEDGVVISDTAASKLTSNHLYKKSLSTQEAQAVGLKKFMANKSTALTKDQMGKLGDDGIIKPGLKVTKGDTLIAALSEKAPTTEAQMLKNLHRSLANPYDNRSVTWDQDCEGEVVAVNTRGKDIQVHVRTAEPMQVGDKLCYDEKTEVLVMGGWKSIADVTTDNQVCCLVNGEAQYWRPTETFSYPNGGRMYRIKSQQVDLFVTANHRMYVRRQNHKEYELVKAEDLLGESVQYARMRWYDDCVQVVLTDIKIEELIEDYDRPVYCVSVPDHVLYVRRNGKPVWSGNSNRHGGKGIVSRILPDHEMPQTEDGGALEVVMNPLGIAGRLNVGQVLETAAGKLAKKTGKTYKIQNFGEVDNRTKVEQDLKRAKISDKETIIDPINNKRVPGVLVGDQYIIKLQHQVDKKMMARSRAGYDRNLIPKGGGAHGAQALGSLGLYAMLAHGSRANIREMQTLKSDKAQADEVWSALQAGEPIPPPQTTFAYKKFESYLKGMGVNVEKDGNSLNLMPLTDKQVLEMSNGELKDAGRAIRGYKIGSQKPGSIEPEKSGLFDPHVTGGLDGMKFSHLSLKEPMPNPVFEKAVKSVAGVRGPQFNRLISGEEGVTESGEIVPKGTKGATYGPQSVGKLLDVVDVEGDLKKAEARLPNLKNQPLNETRKKVKYLRALKKLDMSPRDAYMMQKVPVIPPAMRPLSTTTAGDLQFDDLNQLYKDVALLDQQLREQPSYSPESIKAEPRVELYDRMQALTGMGGSLKGRYKGIADIISGDSPKYGFVQDKLIKRKQDLTMRSTIIPEPSLSLDDIAIPRKAATELYKPFVVREMRMSTGMGPLTAKQMIEGDPDHALVKASLQRVVEERPLLVKRDPALHKYNIQAFKPKLVEGKAIKIHPLICSSMGADFDGNCCAGSSRIALTFDPEMGIRSLTDVKEVLSMKFSGRTRVIESTGDGYMMEIDIADFPRTTKPLTRDRNGNPVFGTPRGLRVLSYDHTKGTPVFCEVTGVTIEQDCPVVEVKGRRYSVTASDNESMCLYDHGTGGVVKESPVGAEGRLMPVVARVPNSNIGNYDFDYGWMIGAFVSDGFFMGSNESIIGYSKVSTEHRDKFFHALRQWESGKLRRATYAVTHGEENGITGDSTKDHISGIKDLTSLFMDCYDPSREHKGDSERACLYKRLPADVIDFPTKALYGVLSGLLDGDGHLSQDKKGRVVAQVQTSSPYLVDSVKLLCHLLGIRASVTTSHPKKGRLQTHDAYVITLSRVDVERDSHFIRLIGEGEEILCQLRENVEEGSCCKDDRDIVPVPAAIMKFLASKNGPASRSLQGTLVSTKSKTKGKSYVARETAHRMVSLLPKSFEGASRWTQLVEAMDIQWDIIQEVIPRGCIEVFDLIIPETKVFAVNGGLVVWDTMSAYVPMTSEAVDEAHKMLPSRILFNPATANVMYTPTHEAQVGLFMKSEVGKSTRLHFEDQKELQAAVKAGKLEAGDAATVGKNKTTLDRMQMDAALPKKLQGGKLLTDMKYRFTKGEQNQLFNDMARADKNGYAKNIDRMKDMGNLKATHGSFSFGLEDFKVHKSIRDPLLQEAARKTAKLDLDKPKDMEKFVEVYEGAMKTMGTKLKAQAKTGKNPLDKLEVSAGIKGKGYVQLTGAPVLFVDAKGDVVPSPVKRSYSEGLSAADYWAAASGGRKGVVQKVQSVSEPGYLTKLMMNSTMDTLVSEKDCGTSKGISLSLDEPDIVGRYTTSNVKAGRTTIPAHTMITPEVVSKMRNSKVSRVLVRSPMRCDHAKGVCASCMGLNENGESHDLGTNIGVLSAQAIGERGTQLAMRAFHCNHAKSLVFCRIDKITFVDSMESLFQQFGERVSWAGLEETVYLKKGELDVWDGTWTSVTALRRHAPDRPLVLVSDGSATTICQDNHPLATGDEEIFFEEPSTMVVKGQSLVRDLSWLPSGSEDNDLSLDPYLVGMYVAEGCIGYRWTNPNNKIKKPYSIVVTQNPGPIRDKLLSVIPKDWKRYENGKKIEVHSLQLGRCFEELFKRYSRNVCLPSDFIHYSDVWLSGFLCGLVDGDGTIKTAVNGPSQVCIDTTSYALVQQVVMICTRLGIVTSVQATPWRKHSANQGFRVVLRVTKRTLSLLSESVKVSERFTGHTSPDQTPNVQGRPLLRLVKKIRYTNEFVYDLTTESSQLIVGGLLSHNSGGIYEGREAQERSISGGGLDRAMTILHMPKKVKGSAKLSTASGKVGAVKKDPAGGVNITIGDTSHYIPADRNVLTKMKRGVTVKKGDPITAGPINPHELLPLTNMNKVQGYLASELHSIYAPEGIRRRNSEVIVRSLSNVTKVENPGDNDDFIVGDFAPTSTVNDWNKKNRKLGKLPMRHSPVLRGVKQIPLDVQTDWLARLNHENLRGTIVEAAQQGWASQLHGDHPIPPLIYGADFGKGTKKKPWSY